MARAGVIVDANVIVVVVVIEDGAEFDYVYDDDRDYDHGIRSGPRMPCLV
jgi:hypothetical protein